MIKNKTKEVNSPQITSISDLKSMLDLLVREDKRKIKIDSKIEAAITMKEKEYKINEISAVTGLDIKE